MTNEQLILGNYIRKVFLQQKADSAYFGVDGGVSIQKVAVNLGLTVNAVQTEAEGMEALGLLELTTRPSGVGIKHTALLLTELATNDATIAQANLDAETAAFIPNNRAAAKALLDSLDALGMGWRAIALINLDEINLLRKYNRDLKTEILASSSLADLKIRVATLNAMGDRTLAQMKTAFNNKIDAGNAD